MPFNTAPMFLTYHSFLFDHLFDILNTRNPCTTGFKAALRVKNKSSWDPFLDKAYNYIEGLKDALQNPMHTTKRKTGFVGFLLAIKSVKGLFHDLVEQTQAPMNYLLTYKFSQDHFHKSYSLVPFDLQEASTTIPLPNNLQLHTSVF